MRKKLLSLALILILLTGLLVPAYAAQITLGQAQSVTVPDDEASVIFSFVPNKSGYYCFYSYDAQGDPFGCILDADRELLARGDDTADGLNFSICCYMTAGNTYYLSATCYSGSAKYKVQIKTLPTPTSVAFEKAAYTGNIRDILYPRVVMLPESCAQECVTLTSSDERIVRIGENSELHLGVPGTAKVTATSSDGLSTTCTVTVQAPPPLTLNTPWTFDSAKGEQYLRFIAPTAGWYGISSSGDEIAPNVEILDENLDGLNADDGALPHENFFAPVYLAANQLCYFGIAAESNTGTAQVTLQKLSSATAITFPTDRITGYADTVCRLNPVYAPQISIPEELTWKSSNEDVVYVDETGCVSYLAPGNAIITVTSQTGKTADVAVTVLAPPSGSDLTAWGLCGPNLQWRLSTGGLLTVTGTGEMYDLYDNDCHWDDYRHQISRVVFPEGITKIGYGAFLNCTGLTEVTVPDSVLRIGNSAFSGCTSLSRVTLPKHLVEMGDAAFEYCDALKEVTLHEGLKRLPSGAFRNCSSLSEITLPDSLISIGDQAFAGCPIKKIELSKSLKTIGYSALANSDLTQLRLPEGLTELRDYALANSSIKALTVPSTVTQLGSGILVGNNVRAVRFLGKAPNFDEHSLADLKITAFYPEKDPTWTEKVRRDYGGTVTWVSTGSSGALLNGTVAPANVTLTLSQGSKVLKTLSAKNGIYAIADLQTGTYTLSAAAQNYRIRTYTVTVTDGISFQDIALHLIGDIDGNSKVNVGDVAKLISHIRGTKALTDEYQLLCANVNGGKLNIGDVASLYAHVRGTKKLY